MTSLRAGVFLSVAPALLAAQNQESELSSLAVRLVSLPAVTGYERALVNTLLGLLPGAARDRAGNATVTLGSGAGAGKRLVVCPLDEPGYVVGGLREDGYLTLRRVPGRVSPLFDQQLEGHRVTIQGSRGPVPGVVAVRSIHLTRGRSGPGEEPFSVDGAFVDVGARSRAEAAALGLAVLAPVTLAKRPHRYGEMLLAAPVAGRRAACAALVAAIRSFTEEPRPRGTVVAAFAVEQELGERGLATLANGMGPFDQTLILDGRAGLRGTLQQGTDPDSSARWPKLGAVSRWSLSVGYPGTAVETVSLADAESLRQELIRWIGSAP